MALFRRAIEHLAKGLTKTRQRLVGSLRSLLAGRKVDQALLDEVEEQLILADVGVSAATKIRMDLAAAYSEHRIDQGEQVLEFLKAEMKKYWPEADRGIHFADTPPTVILVAGVNGSGKTTSIGKLAHLFKQDGKRVCLAAADTYRAAAVQQLSIWAERIGVDIIKGTSGGDPAAVAFDACAAAAHRHADVLLVDTAGRLHTQENLMRELTKMRDVVARKIPGAPHEVLLVLDATTGQNAISQARVFMESIGVTGIFLAKLDGTAKGGIVVAIRNELGLPVKFVGIGEKPADVEPFDPDSFVEALFA
ncbi:MAG: signal recognition particle-docking protein FtsY [Phycisphaerae bacterium SM23_33]|nr:MAG: signal recognition particle-docking protein FtsY [Phycisphaerae bacterium SM23_33]